MMRAWLLALPVILVNALVQGLLTLGSYSPDSPGLNLGLAVLSALVLLKSIVWVNVVAVLGTRGEANWAVALKRMRERWLVADLWALGVALVAAIGFALWTVPGIIVLAITPFVLFAAATGERHALRANFAVLGRRFWLWLLVTLGALLVGVLWFVVSGFVDFFLRGMLGAFTAWTVTGILFALFTFAYARIFAKARGKGVVS